jgi:hypothetical protein
MICCTIVLRLLGWIHGRFNPSGGGSAEGAQSRRFPLALLVLLAGVEIAIVVALLAVLSASGPSTAMHHHGAQMAADAGPVVPSPWALIASASSAAVVAAVIWAIAHRRRTLSAAAGLVLALGTAILARATVTGSSHFAAMVVLESVTVLTPLCLIGIGWNKAQADDVWVVARAGIAISAGLGVIAVIVTAHTGQMAMETTWWLTTHWWSVGAASAVGSVFWASVLRFRLPQALRLAIVGVVLEVGSLLALAMLVGAAPMRSSGVAGLSGLADQRLAGLFMMIVDAGLLALWWRTADLAVRSEAPTRAAA